VEAFLFSMQDFLQMNVMQAIRAMSKKSLAKPKDKCCKYLSAAVILCFLLAFLQVSCSLKPEKQEAARDQGIFQKYVQEPFILIQRASKKEITIAEQLELVLEAAVPENTDVEFPSYSTSLGDFSLIDTSILPARMTGSGGTDQVERQVTYLLEPYLSGTYTIPAMTVTLRDRKTGSEVAKLVTQEIQVPVHSLLGPDNAAVEIKDIMPPLSLPPDRIQQFLLGGLVLLMAVLAIIGLYYWKKIFSQKVPAAMQLRPEEIALQELNRLLAEDLLARGAIKLFHLRISDILRHYVENRFGLKAPERTTEEFLLELSQAESSASAVLHNHKTLLTDFLTQCDLVKFAMHEPSIVESQKTVMICREFIEKTKEKVSRVQGVEGSRGRGNRQLKVPGFMKEE
jgi:hypothetical protein